MTKFNTILIIVLSFFLLGVSGQAQKREREFRIKADDFPSVALEALRPYLNGAKRKRFYKEFDGDKTSFEAKFKKGRLFYSVEFDSIGQLEDVEFIVTKNDIPASSFERISDYLNQNFVKTRIKKIQQQYPIQREATTTLREAFQNLLLPYLNYELIISQRAEKGFEEYELLFDAEGNFLSARKSIPQKYDHVLY